MTIKDHMGEHALPQEFSLSQSVASMMMDLPQLAREAIELATKQAMENPEDFARYIVIMLGDHHQHLNTILDALIKEGTLAATEDDNVTRA